MESLPLWASLGPRGASPPVRGLPSMARAARSPLIRSRRRSQVDHDLGTTASRLAQQAARILSMSPQPVVSFEEANQQEKKKMKTFRNGLLMASCVLALASVQGLQAADYEVFGGYSVTKMRPDNGANSATMNGWNTS